MIGSAFTADVMAVTTDVLKHSVIAADKGVVLASSRLSAERTVRVRDPSLTTLRLLVQPPAVALSTVANPLEEF